MEPNGLTPFYPYHKEILKVNDFLIIRQYREGPQRNNVKPIIVSYSPLKRVLMRLQMIFMSCPLSFTPALTYPA